MIIALLISLFLLLGMPMMGQMMPINLPADGDWPTIVGDSIMLIGPQQNELTEEQRYFNPVYLMTYPGKEHLKEQMIRAALCDCDPTKPNRRIGVFSVSGDKKVSFSQGNLQYLPAANIWKFADTQYEYLGNANKYLKPTFRNWVDLFGWSANNTTAPFGVSTSTNVADYAGDFVDWGTNAICGDAAGTWRTMSADEWEFLLEKRKNASNLYGVAKVAGENGLIILPDDWKVPEGIIFKAGLHSSQVNDFSVYQSFTADEWKVMEEAGAVFLHASGYRDGATVEKCNTSGYYWSNTTSNGDDAYRMYFYSYFLGPKDVHSKYRGRSVRLVHDTIVPEPPKRIGVFSVAADKQVSFSQGNLQYIQSTDTWQFAANQLEYMGHKHYRNGQLADTIEYFGWSGKNSKTPWGISLSTESSDYAGEFLDWGTNTIAGSAPNTWRTLSNEELLYICKGRKNADQLLGLGKIDTICGLIILPDDWVAPEGITFTPNTNNPIANLYSLQEWAIMEAAGAVFIPPTGYFNHKLTNMREVNEIGYYRVSKLADDGRQIYMRYNNSNIAYSYSGNNNGNLFYAFPVRLVHDTIVPKVEPEYVDLGLSVKWATFNVGASKPEDYGDYFAWGETEPKETYSWATYKWCQGTANTFTKYCSNSQYGNADYKTTLDPEDDAAIVHLGGNWRMPTIEEWMELKQNCTWKKITINGITGCQVTAKNGNSIFLPRAGLRMSNILYAADSVGYYASSNHLSEFSHEDYASYMLMYDSSISKSSAVRYYGLPIRPVYDDRVTLTVTPTPEDAKVSFHCNGYQWAGHSITVDKGKDVLYQVTNVDAGYLSQGDSIYNLINDSVLYVTLHPFSDGNWVVVDNSELTKYENYYISRNGGSFAGPYSNWDYYVLPVMAGETYRVRAVAGQLAPVWFAASTAPDLATKTRPKKVSCSDNKGAVAYVADEVTIPEGAKYLIINNRRSQAITVERKVPDPCLVVKVNDTLSINLMCVEGGTFMMGAMEGDEIAKDDEKPAHKVTLTYDYHIMQTEVTQSLWEAVMGEDIYVAQTKMANASKPAYVGGNYPMYYVRMNDALEFIDKLNAMTGMHFRLPTEAEWEYAARGGNKSKGYLYAGSNNADDVGWYISRGGLHRVAQLKPNELGIYDMSGNVGEMCLDYGTYGETYKAGDVVNPRGNIRANGNRFWRGGSYTHSKDSMRVSQRSSYTPSWGGTWLGLRLVLAEDNDFRTIRVGNSYFDMSFVKGGTFMMGSDAPGAEADEQPVHKVSLSDYYIGQTEVTQHLWKKVMGDDNNPSAVKGNNLPITNITWNEAQQFVERLSELTGMHFRLPTEAEWEYAARGGQKSKGYTYAGSNDIDEVGWYNGNSSNKTHAVGQKQSNELGIYDMTGNAWEWCQDWYGAYSAGAQSNPQGPESGSSRVLRSGSYTTTSERCAAKYRQSRQTDYPDVHIGLRIVLEPQKYYRYGYTQAHWDAATASWGHQGRGHAPADQSCIQGTMVHGIRLKVAYAGSLNVYKVPSLLEKTEDNFELVATLTTQTTGLQDFDFAEPIYIAPNEYLVFGKPSEEEPTLRPCWLSGNANGLPAKAKGVAHYIGTGKAEVAAPNGSLMVEFY